MDVCNACLIHCQVITISCDIFMGKKKEKLSSAFLFPDSYKDCVVDDANEPRRTETETETVIEMFFLY